ncbi:hypothetical protein ACLB2K_068331 [Fragaria x ananassa]
MLLVQSLLIIPGRNWNRTCAICQAVDNGRNHDGNSNDQQFSTMEMEDAIIARCCFNSKTIAFPIYSHTKYKDISDHISSRFESFDGGEVKPSYAFGGYSACLLQTDMDVQMMYLSLSTENKSSIDIMVNFSVVSPGKNGGNSSLIFQFVEPNNFDHVNHHLEKFASPSAKKYLSIDWKTYIMHVGQQFEGGVDDFREKLAKYAIEKGFHYRCLKNEPSRVTVNQLRSSPLIRPVDIVKDFKRNYGIEISYYNAWKGKEMAKRDVHGDEAMSYKHLEWYVNELEKTNPGSYATLECDADHRFVRMFISFQGCIKGFKHCISILALDGTHIKNKYKGHLLSAIGKNGNNGIYPLAYAIVASEDENNWTWFMENLNNILKDQGRIITFISDRCKGLLEAVSKVFPDSPHGYCLHHLQKNLRNKYPNSIGGASFRETMVSLFNCCAYASTNEQFAEELSRFKKVGGKIAIKFLASLPDENWSNAYFPGKRYGEMCSNIAESFNSWVKEEHELPIYELVDGIRLKVMKMNSERRLDADTWNGFLCPVIEKQVDVSVEAGRH